MKTQVQKVILEWAGTIAGRSFAVTTIVLVCFAMLLSFTPGALADSPPTPQQVQFAQKTSDLMLAARV